MRVFAISVGQALSLVTEREVQILMLLQGVVRPLRDLVLFNYLYRYAWEADVLKVTKAGYFYEYEIKVTHRDFIADMKKVAKHSHLNMRLKLMPNRFCYVCPPGLINKDEVPEYAGLIWISGSGVTEQKKIPLLHKTKVTDKFRAAVIKTSYNRMWRMIGDHANLLT